MLIKEYRIPLPLTVEEYRIAQLYMIAVSDTCASYYFPSLNPSLKSEFLKHIAEEEQRRELW